METKIDIVNPIPAKKPAPDIYRYVLDKLQLKPQDCLAFEDSENGLRSSLGAGLRTVVTITDYTRDQDFRDAALVLDHLGEPQQPFKVLTTSLAPNPERYFDLALARRLADG